MNRDIIKNWAGRLLFDVLLIAVVVPIWVDKKLQDYSWDIKSREKAESVVEYLSLATTLKEDSSREEYLRANKLLWELALWLPEDVYREVVSAVTKSDYSGVWPAVLSVRKIMLEDKAGNLTNDDFGLHKPGIGVKK